MFEKVNPEHPDKIADRIAGALVDLAYAKEKDPRIAVEVLIGHGACYIISETSAHIEPSEASRIVERIAGKNVVCHYHENPQDVHLSGNQQDRIRCGDNGIFKGSPVTFEQKVLTRTARRIFAGFPTDGKYILSSSGLVICQSYAVEEDIRRICPDATAINPLGYWTGGPGVDAGATNRKLGSDMGDSVTGGGLHGKDLSKADVSVNIYAWLKAQETGKEVNLCCAIGDDTVDGIPYEEIVETARDYIEGLGGFEKFAEWGLVR